jgi:uncharacterized protein
LKHNIKIFEEKRGVMIKDIVSYRRQGMSFRKIAEKLNSTVGKVHYQWIKNLKDHSSEPIDTVENNISESNTKTSEENYLVTRYISANKIASNWKIAPWQRELIASYFNMETNQKAIVFRVYDVTDIIFNGSNAHSYYEFQLPNDKTYWVIKGIKPERSYITEIGYQLNHQQFFPILRSNTVFRDQQIKDFPTTNLELSLKQQINKPEWIEKVSTYSYYENINKENLKNE